MNSKEGVWKTIPVLFQKVGVTATWKGTAAPVLSLEAASRAAHTPREGQRDAPDSAQAVAFLSARDKVRRSFRHPGWLLKARGRAGLCCACSIPTACAGEQRLWKRRVKSPGTNSPCRAPAQRSQRGRHAQPRAGAS